MEILSLDNLQGRILLISPKADDIVHADAVALVYRHSKNEGASALLLSRPTVISFQGLLKKDLDAYQKSPLDPEVYIGGVLSPELGTVVHTGESMFDDSVPIDDTLYYSHSPQAVSVLLVAQEKFEHASFYLGHMVWKPGQLEQEIVDDQWFLTSAKPIDVLKSNPYERYDELWAKMGVKPCTYFELSDIDQFEDEEEDDLNHAF